MQQRERRNWGDQFVDQENKKPGPFGPFDSCWPQIVALLQQRDHKLESLLAVGHSDADLLDDNAVELLSEFKIDINRQLERLQDASKQCLP